MKRKELLDKYYSGETSLEEEKELKQLIADDEKLVSERDVFAFFEEEKKIPENLDETVFLKLDEKLRKGKRIRMQVLRALSAAAAIVVIISAYTTIKNSRNKQLNNEFFTMEQALYQVSESIQPEEQEDMLILWVNDNVEIIIH